MIPVDSLKLQKITKIFLAINRTNLRSKNFNPYIEILGKCYH